MYDALPAWNTECQKHVWWDWISGESKHVRIGNMLRCQGNGWLGARNLFSLFCRSSATVQRALKHLMSMPRFLPPSPCISHPCVTFYRLSALLPASKHHDPKNASLQFLSICYNQKSWQMILHTTLETGKNLTFHGQVAPMLSQSACNLFNIALVQSWHPFIELESLMCQLIGQAV